MTDDAAKLLTKRVGLLEEMIEIVLEQNAGMYRALVLLSKRHGATGADPMAACLVSPPNWSPVVLPPGLEEELNNGSHKVAVDKLDDPASAEFQRRKRLIYTMRDLRSARQAKKQKSWVLTKPSGGGAPGALS